MSHPQKIRVAVLYGGRSGEHEISLLSAANVMQYLDKTRFEILPILIDKQGTWFLDDGVTKKIFNPLAKESNQLVDVFFPVIHGPLCEDGTVQGLLELTDLPYVGCGVLASAVGMDKDVSKRLVKYAGIDIAPYVSIKKNQWDKNAAHYCELIKKELEYPLFVKPANMGSSVGIRRIKQPEELLDAVQDAFQYDTKIVIEQGIDAIEIEVAVLESLDESADPIVSVVGEIRPSHDFYSYVAKYLDEKGAELIIPAPISHELQEQVRVCAKTIFSILECEGMARVDLFLEKSTHKIYFNEINSLPGFTQISMYPKLMTASGIGYTELLSHLLQLAINRQSRKAKLSREYIAV